MIKRFLGAALTAVLLLPSPDVFAQALRASRPAVPAAIGFVPAAAHDLSRLSPLSPNARLFAAPLQLQTPPAGAPASAPRVLASQAAAPVQAAHSPSLNAGDLLPEEQRVIDRVLDASIMLAKVESPGVSEDELRTTVDKAWGELAPESKAAAPDSTTPEKSLKALARLKTSVTNGFNSVKQGLNSLSAPLAVLAPATTMSRNIPSPLVMPTAALATVGVDAAARWLFPALFGFTPIVGLWVMLGLGSVLIPALLASRLSLMRQADPALSPLTRYMDGLLGVFTGAGVMTALGTSGLSFSAAVMGAVVVGNGLISLAPLLGLLAFMGALPVLYGSGMTAWGLIKKIKAKPTLPLPFPMNIVLLSMVLAPAEVFALLTGSFGFLGTVVLIAAGIIAYRLSVGFLTRMTAKTAVTTPPRISDEQLREQWRIDRVPGPATTPDREILRSRLRAAAWGIAMLLGALGLLFVTYGSIPAALMGALSNMKSALMMLPMIFLSSWLATQFMGADKVKPQGPYPDMVRDLASRAKIPMPGVYAAKNTGKPNAFASGIFQSFSVVAVIGSITRLLTVRELRGVLGHETSHLRYRHMLTFMAAFLLLQTVSLAGFSSLLQAALNYWMPFLWVISLLGLMRANENMADAGAAKLTGDPLGLATSLRKLTLLGTLDGSRPQTFNWISRLLLTHPPGLKRFRTLGRMIKKTPPQKSPAGPLPDKNQA